MACHNCTGLVEPGFKHVVVEAGHCEVYDLRSGPDKPSKKVAGVKRDA